MRIWFAEEYPRQALARSLHTDEALNEALVRLATLYCNEFGSAESCPDGHVDCAHVAFVVEDAAVGGRYEVVLQKDESGAWTAC